MRAGHFFAMGPGEPDVLVPGRPIQAYSRFELTDKGKAEVESDAMRFLRRRIELSGRLSLIEQAYWQRQRHEDTDSSSAQPHRPRSVG